LTLPPHNERLDISTATLNDERRQLSPSHQLVNLLLTMANICLLHHCSFFFRGSNGVTTGIGSLAAGMVGHVVKLGIGQKGLRKNKYSLGALTFSIVDFVANAPLNTTICLSSPCAALVF
jgi:hypothetical protein